ncbi:PREDICTED: N-alpha-acetyltransferase 60-like [Priapulus caudatus]|uniref:N-alpha-acetyltransferase 60 n=1 Tax=Priapulus caudatus TaxID=37621 RepID=A0ABM1ENR1_PRICU|nr:PREDICTED: N-alpha-acetyltransferase 60-like [Priapulus caudatus]XP_014673833.1 PREDICTED: N-alpha-acetyltransferase 60-like [Priapulus caudatus]
MQSGRGDCIVSEIQLRFLVPDDIDDVKALCKDWFPIEYPEVWYKEITSNPEFYALAAIYNGSILGLIVSETKTRAKCNKEDQDLLANSFPSGTQVAYILSLGVVKDYRRHGIASLLLDNLISYLSSPERSNCKAIYLHVLCTNKTAIRFYERRYFTQHCYLPYYYSIQGVSKDGFSYALYINGGQPPWSFMDYVKQFGSVLAKLQPCAIPQRMVRGAGHWLCRMVSGVTVADSHMDHKL